jgi:hypothetical protein
LAEDAFGDGEGDAFVGIDALPGFEVVVLIVGGEGAVEGDVIANHFEPVDLALVEAGFLGLFVRGKRLEAASTLLIVEPLLEALLDEFGEGGEGLVLGIDAVADKADEIGQDLDGVAGEGALFEVFVGFPDFGGRDVVGWLADRKGEGFELSKRGAAWPVVCCRGFAGR